MRMRSGDDAIWRISLIVCAALLIYVAFSFFGTVVDPLRTSVLQAMTVEDSFSVSGYIIREETVLAGDGYVSLAGDGEKISVGDTVAVKYDGEESAELATEINKLKSTIAQLEKEQNGRKSVKEQAFDSILSLSSAVESGSLSDVGSSVISIKTYIMGGSTGENVQQTLDELNTQLKGLELAAQSNTSYVKASVSGIFSSVTDGYEYISCTDAENMNPQALSDAFSGKSAPTGAVGKLVTGLDWYYCVIVDSDKASDFKTGKTVSIDFEASFGKTVNMTVYNVSSPSDGKSVVMFTSNKYISDIAALRTLSGTIHSDEISGILISKDIISYDEEGNPYVYILAGLQARKVNIRINYETDNFVLAEEKLNRSDDSVLLRVGAEIIVSAKGLYDGKVVK